MICIEGFFVLLFALPALFGIKPYVVTSGSMEPKFKVGSIAYVKKTKEADIKVGDTITFYMKNSNIVATHEVYEVDKKNLLFRTQGINNKDDNGNVIHDANPVLYKDVIGKAIFCIPYLGIIYEFVLKSPGLYIILGITIGAVLISFLIDRKGGKHEK